MRRRKLRIDARCGKDQVPRKGPEAEPRRWTGIIDRIPKGESWTGAEIGVLKGQTAREILQARPLVYHILVDPWSDDKDESYINSGSSDSKQEQSFYDECFKITSIRMEPFKDRVEFMRMKSVDASHLIEDNSLDYVFIDADHSYEGVARDIKTWISKVRPGGWIGGHDYNDRHYPSVSKAVHENFDNVEIGPDHTWFVRIK